MLHMDWKDKSLSCAERAKLLVSQMTLEEKASQMAFGSSALPRFGIPEYNWWNEALHGVARAGSATVFPQAIGMAASFNVPLLNEVATVIGKEARYKHNVAAAWGDRAIYKGLTMWSPNINIFRDPRWGRGHETYGEDPMLTSLMGVGFIEGLQSPDESGAPLCDATAKHFAVHSGPENDRHKIDIRANKKDMALTYLPAFKAAVQEAGVHAVMGAYNRVNGEAACASETLLQKTLRDEWGFEGYVVSDCGAIEDIWERHRMVETAPEAVALAIKSGCDLCCGWAFSHMLEAVKLGLLDEETITRSVERLMTARIRLGLLDEAFMPEIPADDEDFDGEKHHALSLKMAEESLVLLKNENTLPLDLDKIKTIAVIGPNADSREALIGNYNGTPSVSYTVLQGIRELCKGKRVLYAQGSVLTGPAPEAFWGQREEHMLAEALHAAHLADAVILVTGLNGTIESEEGAEGYGMGDRVTLELPEPQRNLISALQSNGKPMVWVNMTGSATVFPCAEKFGAIVQAWYPGQMGGIAVANAIFGKSNFSGRLPVTFYESDKQLPPFVDYSMQGRTYRYFEGVPTFPFGFGLSYTSFAYDNLQARRVEGGVRLSVQVENTGARSGMECVQAYVEWLDPAYETPLRQLAAIAKADFAPGEKKTIELFVPEKILDVCDDEGVFHRHGGMWRFSVGSTQSDARSASLTGNSPLTIEVQA